MDRGGGGGETSTSAAGEVLYEIRRHANLSLSLDSASSNRQSQVSDDFTKGGLISYLPLKGVKRLREKWQDYRRQSRRPFVRSASLFPSPDGEYVAVAIGYQVFILQKDDDYMEPCGIFSCSDRQKLFCSGAWSESQRILGLVDDSSNLYFIKVDGVEIARKTSSQLKLSAPVLAIIVQEDLENSFVWFCIFTIDGFIYHVELTPEHTVRISPFSSSTTFIEKTQLPQTISCLDFHPDLSLAAIVSGSSDAVKFEDNSGTYSLYILKLTTQKEVELLCACKFEGLFTSAKYQVDPFTLPKVAVSPDGKYVAAVDLSGGVDVFKIEQQSGSFSVIPIGTKQVPDKSISSSFGKKYFNHIFDLGWWANHVLVVSDKTGSINMYDIMSGVKVSMNDSLFCMPIIQRINHRQGFLLVLENILHRKSIIPIKNCKDGTQINEGNISGQIALDSDKLSWSLLTFSSRSVSEMYTSLIKNQDYKSALNFASRHELDTDEVFKAEWLHSVQGTHEIDLYLPQIKDLVFVLSECVERIGDTEVIMKALLSHGLKLTQHHKISDTDDEESSFAWKIRMYRLQLLQYKDRLETFLGINMGRFSAKEYYKFRSVPLKKAAIVLAESGKIGALNLLFKRHPFSVSPHMLSILSSVPETVPVQSYAQLLPGKSPPSTFALRDSDWVECEKMVSFLNKLPSIYEKNDEIRTENILKLSVGFVWPSVAELSEWYTERAKDIDNLSGQLENCLSLVELASRKGICELQQFLDDIKYLHQLIYSVSETEDFSMSLNDWENLPDYEKFKVMLKGVKEDTVVQRLKEIAIPFMKLRFPFQAFDAEDGDAQVDPLVHHRDNESFMVRWLKEIAAGYGLDICLSVFESGFGNSPIDGLFKDEVEAIETALQCIYLCTVTDQWSLMASILSMIPRSIRKSFSFGTNRDLNPNHDCRGHENNFDSVETVDNLEKRIQVAEGHVEVGRLMAYYQGIQAQRFFFLALYMLADALPIETLAAHMMELPVLLLYDKLKAPQASVISFKEIVPKPLSFFVNAHSDEKNVKQLLRLMLSKFGRRQPVRSDNDWASMWNDMQIFQEKAFPFLDLEYMLTEFIRGLLKAGKFALARNYLRGTGSIALATEKAENLVIQAAREYFFSASSLSSNEIWKAKECLSLFPSSKSVKAEIDIIDALTIKLPKLGVTLLPMQFKQIRNPMEIINMVITSQTGAYLNVDELIEIAKLLGLSSQDDIAAIEEAVAREAAVVGDLQLVFDLCLILVRKGHGPVWDLCAAIARGPQLDNMDANARKHLLGFALCHCDDESVGELLNAWKEIELHNQSEQLMASTGSSCYEGSSLLPFPARGDPDTPGKLGYSEHLENESNMEFINNDQVQFEKVKNLVRQVSKDYVAEDRMNWDSILREDKKLLSFASQELPWLLELCKDNDYKKELVFGEEASVSINKISIRMQALLTILYWLAENNIAPSDDLIIALAKSTMEPPVSEEDDVLGCSFLLNLIDAFRGVEVIEHQLNRREAYQEIYSMMNIGMAYSSLNNAQKECTSPTSRRKILLHKFHEKHLSFSADDQIYKVQSTFWREWKMRLEQQKRLADQTRVLEQIIPGIETARFLSGDAEYIKTVIFSFIDSVKQEKKHILKQAVQLADTYGLNNAEVVLKFLGCALVSEHWGNEDILAEISEFRDIIVKNAKGVVDTIYSSVYAEVDGHNKERLSYIYSILSACFLRLQRTEDPALATYLEGHMHILEPFQYYKILEQECMRVSSIKKLNFKNIAGLEDLNFEHFNEEICNNINDSTVETLADMVQTLFNVYYDSQAKGLISREGVYKHHVLGLLASLEGRNEARSNSIDSKDLQVLIKEIEENYDSCKKYVSVLPETDISYIVGRYCSSCFPSNFSRCLKYENSWRECLVVLLSFWIKLVDDIPQNLSTEVLKENSTCFETASLSRCLKTFQESLVDGEVSVNQGWNTISNYVKLGLQDGLTTEILPFCKAMILSGCSFESTADSYYAAQQCLDKQSQDKVSNIENLPALYIHLLEKNLSELNNESDGYRKILTLLSSLSRISSNHSHDLKLIREEVWRKLSEFSHDMVLSSNTRMYALQLMQCITGKNLKTLPPEIVSEVEPWEEWSESCSTNAGATQDGADVTGSISSSLVALKSTQLVGSISTNIKITPEDLMTLESAVSCFLRLCENVSSVEHLNILQTILEEWEEIFSTRPENEMNESLKDNWSGDEWGDGWETLPDELNAELKQDRPVSVSSLHTCWMEIIKRYTEFSKPHLVMELLDNSLRSSRLLLDEDETQSLMQLVVGTDCFMAMKLALLQPHEAPQSRCLRIVESRLQDGTVSTASNEDDYELLMLLLSSGVMGNIATDPSYCKLFVCICHMVGYLVHASQQNLLNFGQNDQIMQNHSRALLFGKVLLPYFVSELISGGQPLLAGFIVNRWMHTHTSFAVLDVVESSLIKYLEAHILSSGGSEVGPAEIDSSAPLKNTLSHLRNNLGRRLQLSLLTIKNSTK